MTKLEEKYSNYGSKIVDNSIQSIGNTPLIDLSNFIKESNVKIYGKLESVNPTGSVKDRAARSLIVDAEEKGLLKPGGTILEPTSGNTGLGIAMIGRQKGYQVKVVMPESVPPERVQLLEAFGAEVIFSAHDKGTNESIALAKDISEDNPNFYMPYQYGNEANPLAHYYGTGKEIIDQLPEIDIFVAGLGTGGTLMGTGRRLKEYNPEIKVVAAAPQPGDAIQALRSIEDGFVPPILDLDLLDARIMVSSEEAFKATKMLLDKEGIFAGISCGAVVASALKVARRLEKGNIVCLLADAGWKYLSTNLWTKEYSDLQEELESKLWW